MAGLEALPWTIGLDEAPYRIHRGAAGFSAANDVHGLSLSFGRQGVQVRAGGDTLSLRLHSVGYGRQLRAVHAAAPEAHASQVSYHRGSLREWYANGPLGVEQGFTLSGPPARRTAGPLTLALSLAGSLRPTIEPGAKSLSFAHSGLRYGGLAAFDARGHELPARLALRGRTLLIRVVDAGARYPLTIDPLLQLAKLTASDGTANSGWPRALGISGDTVVVLGGSAADVFVEPPAGWASATQTARLTVPGALGLSSAAISGDTIVVAAGGGGGGAYVFVEPVGGWVDATPTARLSSSSSDGRSFANVAISGDTIVAVGGAADALVFVKPPGGWTDATETATLTGSIGFVGGEVAISGDTIVAASGAGGQVFVKPPGGWTDGTETARLASPGGAYTQFGSSVGIAGNTVVVGAPATQAENADNAKGVVYVFVKPAGGWADEPYTALLTPPDAEQRDNLGTSVAISGNTIVAGAPQLPYHPFETPHRNGKAYAFVSPNGGWTTGTQVTKLTASDGAPGDGFGSFVGVSGDSVVVGAPGADISGNTNQGAAYAFGEVSATIVLKKQLAPSSDAGRFDLKVGQTVVKAGAGNGGFGSLEVLPGTYRVSESAVAGASLSSYASSIACTLNGNPGPSADGTTKLDVTVAKDDVLACTFTNKRRAQIALTKHLTPADDAGRFDLKVAATVVKSGAGDGDSGSTQVGAGSYSLSEVAAAGTSLTSYASSIACTRNGAAGPSGNGASLKVTVGWGDVLACTITNQRGAAIKLVKQLAPGSDPGRFDLKVGGTVVKAGAGNGGSGSLGVPAGTYRVAEGAAPGTSLSDYATAIACTLNGSPGPSASGTTQLDVTVAVGDVLTCTITNKHKVRVTLLKHLVPSSDPGRFDLKLSSSTQVKVVKAGAGDGDSGSVQVAPGTWTVQESAAPGTSLSDYTSSIACTRNGNAGPSGNAASLPLTLAASDVVVCTITNRRT